MAKRIIDVLSQTVEATEMPTILKNGLIRNGITEIKQIICLSKYDTYMLINFGKRRQELLTEFLKKHKLSLRQ